MDADEVLKRKDVILIASRTLALLFLAWALVDLAALPEHLFSLVRYRMQGTRVPWDVYMSRLYLIATISVALRMIALFAAAEWLWRGGPKVESLFSRSSSRGHEMSQSREISS